MYYISTISSELIKHLNMTTDILKLINSWSLYTTTKKYISCSVATYFSKYTHQKCLPFYSIFLYKFGTYRLVQYNKKQAFPTCSFTWMCYWRAHLCCLKILAVGRTKEDLNRSGVKQHLYKWTADFLCKSSLGQIAIL